MIRYRTRDLAILRPPTSRSMRRMSKVTGRTDDMLIIRGVNLFPSQVEELILGQPRLAPHYVLDVCRNGSLDELTVKVEPHPGLARPSECTQAAADLQHNIKVYIGITAAVVVCDPGTVERSIGKAKRVIDRRA
jgi:phenylacetate-CoA ligase